MSDIDTLIECTGFQTFKGKTMNVSYTYDGEEVPYYSGIRPTYRNRYPHDPRRCAYCARIQVNLTAECDGCGAPQ